MRNFRVVLAALLVMLLLQGCFRARTRNGVIAPTQDELSYATTFTPAPVTPTSLSSPTLVPTSTEISPTPQLSVTISAVGGNLYIRRGPDTRYDRIGVLKKSMSARVIAQDQLSRWVQINLPGSELTGWVSVQTDFSQVDGDLDQIPYLTFTDWPLPAYVVNCTEHDLLIEPGEWYLYSLYSSVSDKNEYQLDPGVYTVKDLFVAGEPKFETIDVREGTTTYITVDGLGENHKCP